jgi:hypothetical protein
MWNTLTEQFDQPRYVTALVFRWRIALRNNALMRDHGEYSGLLARMIAAA